MCCRHQPEGHLACPLLLEPARFQYRPRTIRFLLVSGKPLEEPVAWYGPIVMNTQEQLQRAFTELQEGTFLKKTRGE
jgi:redox-sensitive bicupin YhaK (pirin superfamily)